MEFKSGMLGCAIVMVMLACSVLGTILISADETTYNVTKYRYETDITGLFPVDTSPEYLDYDLAKNYTGYYTEDTIINGVKYWGGATFTPSTTVNNYSLRTPPVNETITQYNLSDYTASLTDTDVPPNGSALFLNYYMSDYSSPAIPTDGSIDPRSVTLTSLIDVLHITNNIIEITPLSDDWDDLIFFTTPDKYFVGSDVFYYYLAVDKQYYDTYPSDIYDLACLSCKINMTTRTVDYYYGISIDNTTYVYTVNLSDACICCDTENNNFPTIDRTIVVRSYDQADTQYMDISMGVTVTGVTT